MSRTTRARARGAKVMGIIHDDPSDDDARMGVRSTTRGRDDVGPFAAATRERRTRTRARRARTTAGAHGRAAGGDHAARRAESAAAVLARDRATARDADAGGDDDGDDGDDGADAAVVAMGFGRARVVWADTAAGDRHGGAGERAGETWVRRRRVARVGDAGSSAGDATEFIKGCATDAARAAEFIESAATAGGGGVFIRVVVRDWGSRRGTRRSRGVRADDVDADADERRGDAEKEEIWCVGCGVGAERAAGGACDASG